MEKVLGNSFGNVIRTNEFAQLVKFSEKCSSPSEFLSYPGVRRLIMQIFHRGDIEQSFSNFIKLLINTRKDFDDNARIDLMYLLGTPSKLSIKSYRNYLRVKGIKEWEKYRDNSGDLYTDLSRNMMQYLEKNSFEEALHHYADEIKIISDITKKSPEYIGALFKKYKNAYDCRDIMALSSTSGIIKGLFKEFNGKSKNKFIQDYIEENVSAIGSRFEAIEEDSDKDICLDAVYVLLSSQKIRSKVRMSVNESFGVLLEADELQNFIANVIFGNDDKNIEKLGLKITPLMLHLDRTKAYNRLTNNYMPTLKKLFDVSQFELINDYLYTQDIVERRKFEKSLTVSQKYLLNQIRPILNRADSSIIVENDKFVLKPALRILDPLEERQAKEEAAVWSKYYGITGFIRKAYETSRATILNIGDSVNANQCDDSFTDDNYKLVNMDYLTKLDEYAKIIEMIDINSLPRLLNDRDSLKALKRLLIDEGLISCFICDDADTSMIGKLINRMPQINKGKIADDFTTNNLVSIFKRADFCQYIDDFTLALLGEDVAEKIVYNFQFLQGKNTPEKIAERLHKARYLMINAESIDKSAVPYFEPIEVDGLSIKRYNNNDPKILTSGIDSNTCFKIGANDNDYLFYSILNQNGMVAYFEENGKMCGRITAHLRNNCLLINGIRNIENSYEASSVEQKVQNDKIIAVMKKFGEKMIELTTDSNCPIDFVVANKSGILESNDYDRTFPPAWDDCFLKYVDTYGDDFQEFRDISLDDSKLLQETPLFQQRDKQPFTTDFGHYPLVMIAARGGKQLNSPRDISYSTPESVYERERPKHIIDSGIIPTTVLERIKHIDALAYYFNGNDPKDYILPDFSTTDYDIYEVDDAGYSLCVGDLEISSSFDKEKAKTYKKTSTQQNSTN